MKNTTSTFNLTRTISKNMSLSNSLVAVWNRGAKEQKTLTEILSEQSERVFNSNDYKRLQKWAQNELRGASRAMLTSHYNHLEWVGWYNGVFIGLVKNIDYGKGFSSKFLECAHVYKGTEICFSEKKF